MNIKVISKKILKKYPLSKLIYLSNECSIYESELSKSELSKSVLSKSSLSKYSPSHQNFIQIVKITPYTHKKHMDLKNISNIKHPFLLTPENVKKYGNFTLSVYQYKTPVISKIIDDKLSFNDIFKLALNLCEGIIFLHSRKYLHLDISPNNIYINNDGTFCLGDYSSAQKMSEKYIRQNIYFTKGFSPPEFNIYSKNLTKITELSDEYSIAKTILSLCQTYNNKDNNNMYSPDIPDKFINILNKAASEIPEFRYPDISAFKTALLNFKVECNISQINFNIHFNDIDNPFATLKTEPIKKEYIEQPQNIFFNIINSPIFMTGIILLSILLPILTLYRVFFLPHENYEISQKNITSAYKVNTSAISPTVKPALENDFKDKTTNEIDFNSEVITSISKEQIEKVFGSDINFYSLKIISANNNNISDISKLSSLTNIEELYISGNTIRNINSLKHLNNLKTLIISSNLIEDITPLSNLKHLENLDLSGNNKIKNFNPLLKLKTLKLLCLNETNIKKQDYTAIKKALPQCEIIY